MHSIVARILSGPATMDEGLRSLSSRISRVFALEPGRPTFAYRWLGEGFFSEYDRMLLGILHCALRNWNFTLASRSPALPGEGWRGTFESFCSEFDHPLVALFDGRSTSDSPFYRNLRGRARGALLHVVGYAWFPGTRFMVDEWDSLRRLQEARTVRFEDASGNTDAPLRDALRAIHQVVWRPSPAARRFIEAEIARAAMPRSYVGLHIRRGDKETEAAHTPVRQYVEKIEQLTPLKDLFLLTDDFRVVAELKSLKPDWRVFCRCEPNQFGYSHSGFAAQPSEVRRQRTWQLLADVEALARSEVFVGTFSSAVGEFLGIARPAGTHAVDFEQWTMTY